MCIYWFLYLFAYIHWINGMYLSSKEQTVLDELLEEFKKNPTHYRYDSIVNMGIEKSKYFPKVFLWCPLQHFDVVLKCPIHKCPLKFVRWMSSLDGENYANPRLLYDMEGNIILVQAVYGCTHHERYLSASVDIMSILPEYVKQAFPAKLSYKSACSIRLLDHLLTSVSLGNNFLEITELIASINYRAFARIHGTDQSQSFHDNILFSPASNDKLMHIFLSYLQEVRPFLDSFFSSITCKILCCDHTFKVSKHIGAVRSCDSAFVKQFQNLFVGLNENGEVVLWKLTKSTKCEEINDSIANLKQRLPAGKPLEMVFVDDCCRVRNFYQSHFPNIPVKLDVFHAVQRIVKTLQKGDPQSQTIAKEVSSIFRRNGDVGKERMTSTPPPDEIEANLEIFLDRWKLKLTSATQDAISNLRQHIRKGCLSGIPADGGTSRNERLHRHLKRSLLGGVSSLSPELALAVLSLVLFVWTCRRKELNSCKKNKRVTPIPPLELINHYTKTSLPVSSDPLCSIPQSWNGTLETSRPVQNTNNTCHFPSTSVSLVGDLENENASNFIITRALHLLDLFSNLKSQCSSMLHSVVDIIGMERHFQMLFAKRTSCAEIEVQCNSETLCRNLATFRKVREIAQGDGNCCFRSIIKQLHQLLRKIKQSDYLRFVENIGLNKSEVEDTKHMRQLFCEEVERNRCNYSIWLGKSEEEISVELDSFRKQGWFNSTLGDLTVKICCNVLKVPIVVITSFPQAPHLSFVPEVMAVTEPLYLAYNHSPPGHYDSTLDVMLQNPVSLKGQKYCQCGKHNKGHMHAELKSCSNPPNGTAKCSCLLNGHKCKRLCQCYNCCNPLNKEDQTQTASPVSQTPCRCGSNKKKCSQSDSCADMPGKRKSKCPCLKSGLQCGSTCKCVQCKNPHNEIPKVSNSSSGSHMKRRRLNPDPYQRKSAAEYMSREGLEITPGPWTDIETILLMVVMDTIASYGLPCSYETAGKLFNYVATSANIIQMKLPLGPKRPAQITGKMNYIEKQQGVKKDLIS